MTWKKRPGAPHLPYDDIVEELICFGWIDSLPRTLDVDRSMLLMSPRRPKSNWSKLNKGRAERMIAIGLMMPAGLKKISDAKASGAWSFLDEVDALVVPADLDTAFKNIRRARENWDAFPPSARRGILEWIKNAKGDETRARRVRETAVLAGQNIRANQYRQVLPGRPAKPAASRAQASGKTKV